VSDARDDEGPGGSGYMSFGPDDGQGDRAHLVQKVRTDLAQLEAARRTREAEQREFRTRFEIEMGITQELLDGALRDAQEGVARLKVRPVTAGDLTWNPLLDLWKHFHDEDSIEDNAHWFLRSPRSGLTSFHARRVACDRFAWAVPHPGTLDVLASLSPIIEMGAGAGYWALLLRLRGAHVIAYDRDPPYGTYAQHRNHWHRGTIVPWSPVRRGGPEVLKHHRVPTLFLCWPPYAEPFAYNCLKAYRGRRVAVVGEHGGCTGDDKFEELLEAAWEIEREVSMPQWWGIHDYLRVFKRKNYRRQRRRGRAK
jgi:hypothetical protein